MNVLSVEKTDSSIYVQVVSYDNGTYRVYRMDDDGSLHMSESCSYVSRLAGAFGFEEITWDISQREHTALIVSAILQLTKSLKDCEAETYSRW